MRYDRPTRTAGNEPAWISRYTVMLETRSRSATSATVTKRARPSGCWATVEHPSLRSNERKPVGRVVLPGPKLSGAIGGRPGRFEEGRPAPARLQRPQTGRGGAARGGDRGPQLLGCVARLG